MFRSVSDAETVVEEKKEIAAARLFPSKWLLGGGPITMISNSVPSYKDAANLTQTCRFLFHYTKPALTIRKLAHHIVVEPSVANKAEVIASLNRSPSLLIHKIKLTQNKIRQIIKTKTLYQLAYGAGDNEFCLAMKPAFIQHFGSEQAAIIEMERQRDEMLESKENSESIEEASKAHFQTILQPMIQAIDAEKFNLGRDDNNKLILSSATLIAVETFRNEFVKSLPWVIDKGMHFRYGILVETWTAFIQAIAPWCSDANKCELFEDSLLSTVLAYVPENDAQKFSQGLFYLQNSQKQEVCTRSSTLRVGGRDYHGVVNGPSHNFAIKGSGIDILYGRLASFTASYNLRLTAILNFLEIKYLKFDELVQLSPLQTNSLHR